METATTTLEAIRAKFELLRPLMTERLRRQWAACEAQTLGRGGVSVVAQATGLSRTTICSGLRELQQRPHLAPGFGVLGRTHDARRPAIPVALDLPEYTSPGPGLAWPRPCRQPPE